MKTAEIDQELRGYTIVMLLQFVTDVTSGVCKLNIQLAKDDALGSEAIELEFDDVGQLSIREFGGGVTQVLCVRVVDVSDLGLERVKLRVEEMERDAIRFECRSARLVRRFAVE